MADETLPINTMKIVCEIGVNGIVEKHRFTAVGPFAEVSKSFNQFLDTILDYSGIEAGLSDERKPNKLKSRS